MDSGVSGLTFFCDTERHLVCSPYSVQNLHLMAVELGISRGWFHSGRNPHYDIPKKRIEEITKKCKVVPTRDILRIMWSGEYVDPGI